MIQPPIHHPQIGRPKKKRRNTAKEIANHMVGQGKLTRNGGTVTCKNCGKKGHNKKSCKGQAPVSTSGTQKNKRCDGASGSANQKKKAKCDGVSGSQKKKKKKGNGGGTSGSQKKKKGDGAAS